MSANATNVSLYLQRLPPMAWTNLAPECECCRGGRAVAVCWFAPRSAFASCANCAAVIASGELMAAALQQAFRG